MIHRFAVALLLSLFFSVALASDNPVEMRHEIMEGVKDAAGTVGGMIKGETEFDYEAAMEALAVWEKAGQDFGGLFPEGTYTGEPDTASEAVWTDREGFDKLLAEFRDHVGNAITADPQDAEELGAAAGPVFKNCKKCHETYRLEGD